MDGMARIVLNDFLRGKIPWFMPPPALEAGETKDIEGRSGRLGEMRKKRKREDEDSVPDTSMGAPTPPTAEKEGADDDGDDDEFEGFGSDSEPDLSGIDSDLDDESFTSADSGGSE